MSASKEIMDTLHRLLAEGLVSEFELAAAENLAPNAALAAVARAFLKDNSITVAAGDLDDLDKLRAELTNSSSSTRKRLAQEALADLDKQTLN